MAKKSLGAVLFLAGMLMGCADLLRSTPEPADCALAGAPDHVFPHEARAVRLAEIRELVEAVRRDTGYPRPMVVREASGGLFRGVRCRTYSVLLVAPRSTAIALDRDQSAVERTICDIVWPQRSHECLLHLARRRGETERVRWLERAVPGQNNQEHMIPHVPWPSFVPVGMVGHLVVRYSV
jgi:hypothetical protein